MTIDYENKMDVIVSKYPSIEETAEMMTIVCDANHISKSFRTYAWRNAQAQLIHQDIGIYLGLGKLQSDIDDSLTDVKNKREDTSEPVYGFADPHDSKVHNLDDIKDFRDTFLDAIIGKCNAFFLRFGITPIEAITWTKQDKLGYNQVNYAKQCQSAEYHAVMMQTDCANEHSKYVQDLSYQINGLAAKLKTASQPAVKQYSMFEKDVVNSQIKSADKAKVVEQKKFEQPIIQK